MLFKKLKGHFTTKKISHHTQNLRENKLSFEFGRVWRVRRRGLQYELLNCFSLIV